MRRSPGSGERGGSRASFKNGQDVVLVEGVAGIAEFQEIPGKRKMVLCTVHFADDGGMPLAQSVSRAAKDFALGAFDVALDEIGGRVRRTIIVERNRLNGNDSCHFLVIRGDEAQAAVGGLGEIGAGERDDGRFAPNGLFLDDSMAETVVGKILA